MTIDIDAQIAAVDRAVGTEQRDGEEVRVQTLVQTYRAPLDDVWDALTSPDRIGRWFIPVTGELKLGGHYQFEGNAGGTVQSCEPPQGGVASLGATWEFGGGVSWVTVRLEAVGADATRFELEHVASVAAVPEEMWVAYGPSATGMGWDSGLLGLALHLTDPAARPEDPAAWQVSDEGKRFMRGLADAWAAAHLADGADPDAAAAAADATYRLYVGEAPSPM